MLSSFGVRNYRNLRHLTIEKLGRVNLLVGKNNTGKTSILEAMAIYFNKGNTDFLLQLLADRGENYLLRDAYGNRDPESLKESTVLKTLSALFSDRIPGFNEGQELIIGELENTLFGPTLMSDSRLVVKFVRYVDEYDEAVEGQPPRRRRVYLPEISSESEFQLGLEVKFGKFPMLIPLKAFGGTVRAIGLSALTGNDNRETNYQFIRTKNIDRDIRLVLV